MTTGQHFWSGRRVLVTGHTGFKGTWLCHWLASLGAEVTGIGLEPTPGPSLFMASRLDRRIDSRILDVRARGPLADLLATCRPEIIFHLAAQPLVLTGLEDPLGTFETNVLGVANLLDTARRLTSPRAIVVVTSDKCYLRPDQLCREGDALGGHDPYSASKACAEMVVEAYRSCFFPPEHGVGVATARAGNVIGGGDFSPGRLLPDLMLAYLTRQPASLRNPQAIRPWQHVLDALSGYLLLAERLWDDPAPHAGAWNFGPDQDLCWTAAEVAEAAAERLGAGIWRLAEGAVPIEVPTLLLSSEQAQRRLGWRPRLATADAVAWTVDSYRELLLKGETGWLADQIEAFEALAAPTLSPPSQVEPFHAVA
jgi:CDP-glucose 4,6-dehydratase